MTAQAAPEPVALHQDPTTDAAPQAGAAESVRASVARMPEISRSVRNAVEHWLDWQCRMIAGVHYGYVYVPVEARASKLQVAATWPVGQAVSDTASSYAAKAMEAGRSVLHKAADDLNASGEVRDFVAFPVTVAERMLGVVVLILEIRAEAQRQAVLQLLDWGAAWLEKTLLGLHTDRRGDTRITLQAVSLIADDAPLPVVGYRLCNLLAERFGCTRVALGLTRGMQVQINAFSDQLDFDRRMALATQVQAAMEECVDQDEPVSEPRRLSDGHGLSRAHKRLLDHAGVRAVCSVPVCTDDQTIGAVTLFWDDEELLDSTLTARLADLMGQLAPVVALKQRDTRSLWHRAGGAIHMSARRLLGAGRLRLKLGLVGLLTVLVAANLIQTDRLVTADAAVEGVTQQAIVTPVEGYLLAASARAGDHVEQDQLLATIDDRELLLERQKWQSEYDKNAKEYQEALGARDRAKISVAQARMAQSEAQLKLVADQLQRTKLRAPFAGTLVSGDLSRAIGAPLERGQLLFEIVPTGDYRVGIRVDERDIAGLEVGQQGRLRLSGLPDRTLDFSLSRIVPLASADQAGNHFRVEAELVVQSDVLRPGMQGVAKIVTGQTSLLHAWSDELLDRIRFWLWSLGF